MEKKKKNGPEINRGMVRKRLQLSPSLNWYPSQLPKVLQCPQQFTPWSWGFVTTVGGAGGEKLPAEDASLIYTLMSLQESDRYK